MSSSTKPYEDYILSRVVDDVELLHSQGVLSSADLAAIKGHLSLPRTATGVQPSVSGLSPERGSSEVGAISRRANPPPPRKVAPRPTLDATCRALWDYAQENVSGWSPREHGGRSEGTLKGGARGSWSR